MLRLRLFFLQSGDEIRDAAQYLAVLALQHAQQRILAWRQGFGAQDQVRGLRLAASGRDAWLDLDADTLYEHQTNLEKRLADTRGEIATLEARLSNESYVAKAPAQLVEESREQLASKQALVERLEAELEVLAN